MFGFFDIDVTLQLYPSVYTSRSKNPNISYLNSRLPFYKIIVCKK